MHDWTAVTLSPEETQRLGRLLGETLCAPAAVWLAGDLGAGKTCFTQGLALGLGVPEDEPVTSPSYTLMNHYRGRADLYHFDLYRLTHPDDLHDLGFDEYLHGSGVTVVEWSDRFPGVEEAGLQVRIERRDADSRTVAFRATGADAEEVLSQLARDWREKGDA